MVQCHTAQIISRDKDEFHVNKLGSIMKMKVTGCWLAWTIRSVNRTLLTTEVVIDRIMIVQTCK